MSTQAATPDVLNTSSPRLAAWRQKVIAGLPKLKDFVWNAILQRRIYNKAYAGVMHALIFWGVTIQVLGTAINLMQMQLFIPFVELTFPRGGGYLAFELVMDLAGVAILVGVSMALGRRLLLRPKTLESRWDDYYALTLLFLIPLIGFTLESTRLLSAAPTWASWSPIGNALAGLWRALGMTPQQALQVHDFLFWTHVGVALLLVASIPYTKLRHLVNTPLNILFRPRRQPGIPAKIENLEDAEILGVGKVNEFTTQQLLSFDACVRCGRCDEVCPATLSGMAYSPRQFIQSLRQSMVQTLVTPQEHSPTGQAVNGDLAGTPAEAMAWSCTTCGACLQRCPAFVSPVDEIIDLRRYQALTTGKLPKSVADALRNMERKGNPWGMPPEERLAWSEGLDVRELAPGDETDVLLFLGCAFVFDARNRKVTRAFIHLLQQAGVDFATLGLDETCCGETARRLGQEYLFQVFAEQLIETLKQVKFQRIVTQCPHCFNTLKNEYPQFGANLNVQHYTEYLAEIFHPAQAPAPNGNGVHGKVAYHDSCYLGRYNQIYTQPRQLLAQANVTTTELTRQKQNSFCCGGGGGQMWLETDAEARINQQRLKDALQAGSDVVATACPYCLLMFDDAIRSKGLGEQLQVLDLAEILERQYSSASNS
jgi:Fe-S oxidoreductase/nitrate reductase gamma subunit